MYGVTVPTLKDFRSQTPQAICEVTAPNVNRTMIVNSGAPPFDNPDLRQAMALSLDRKAFIDIITERQGDIGGLCCRRIDIVRRALQAPAKQIFANAGEDGSIIVGKLLERARPITASTRRAAPMSTW